MTISEAQLSTWSSQGSVTQSKATYTSIKTALESVSAPYHGKSYSIFLQGSYGNDTNIYADSDVDVAMMLTDVYYDDINSLSEEDKAAYLAAKTVGKYSYPEFRSDVITRLSQQYGRSVKPGKKAIFIEGDSNRRDCDVLACVELRKYTEFKSFSSQTYHAGICFWTTDGVQIVNFPKQHLANCTTKHQNTNRRFKPLVRIIKNMRNSMASKGYIKEGIAPSYFLEGMLYNVPNYNFSSSYQQSLSDCIDWLYNCTHSELVCANGHYYLCHPSSPVTWRAENLRAFLDAAVRFWHDSHI